MEPCCLFCLESTKENPIRNPIGCSCKIQAHEACFHTWFNTKQKLECPICHTVSLPNRVINDNIYVVYINNTDREEQNRVFRGHEKAVGFCCCILLTWSIVLTILEVMSKHG